MSPFAPWLGLLTGACLLAAPPSVCGQDLLLPGPERQPPTAPRPDPIPPADLLAADGPACLPLSDPACSPTPWYADGEMAVLFTGAVHFNDRFGSVREDNPVFVSPRLFLGRRLPNGGAARFTYRNLTEVGRLGPREEAGGDWSSGHSFTTHWFDLDYVSCEYAPFSWWRVQAEAGGRFVYGRAGWWGRSSYAHSDSSETYFGGGPHLGLTSNWLLGRSGWAVYGRADTAVTFGTAETSYRYRPQQPDWAWWDSPQSDRASRGECQFDLGLQLGLARRGEWRGCAVGLVVGVQADVLSRGNLEGEFGAAGFVNVGPFLRWEVGF